MDGISGGFKLRDGVNRTQVDNLVVGGIVTAFQVSGFDTDVVQNNINIDDEGQFYKCAGQAFQGGSTTANNQFYSPTDAGFNPACDERGNCTTLECWQQLGYDTGSTYSNTISKEQILNLARTRLGMA